MARTRASKVTKTTSARSLRHRVAPLPRAPVRKNAARKTIPPVVVLPGASAPAVAPSTPVPSAPSPPKQRTPRPEKGLIRDIPCKQCLNSALSGKSSGDCYDAAGRGSRCWKCASGHKCEALPPSVVPVAQQFLIELANGVSEARLKHLRSAVKVVFQIAEDNAEEGVEEAPAAAPSNKRSSSRLSSARGRSQGLDDWRERVKNVLNDLVDVVSERLP